MNFPNTAFIVMSDKVMSDKFSTYDY